MDTKLKRRAISLRTKITKLEEQLDKARAERDGLTVELLDAGLSRREAGDLLGISREWVAGARLRHFHVVSTAGTGGATWETS